jgi:hypothetical protein
MNCEVYVKENVNESICYTVAAIANRHIENNF